MTQEPVALMRKTDITEFCEYNMEMAENDNPIAFTKWMPLYSQEYVSSLKNDLEILSKEWVSVAMALGKATKEIHEKQAEIERLSNDNYKFIKAMANKDSHIESLKQLLNDSVLRKAQEK